VWHAQLRRAHKGTLRVVDAPLRGGRVAAAPASAAGGAAADKSAAAAASAADSAVDRIADASDDELDGGQPMDVDRKPRLQQNARRQKR
jgi:hypothetical protein